MQQTHNGYQETNYSTKKFNDFYKHGNEYEFPKKGPGIFCVRTMATTNELIVFCSDYAQIFAFLIQCYEVFLL